MPSTTRSTTSSPRTASNVLRPLADADTAPPASRLAGRPLVPVGFKPERGSRVEADGAGLTKIGARFRDVFSELHGIAPSDVELGLIRLVEALNADTDANHTSLSAIQIKRTEFGFLHQVRFTVNTPLLLPWLPNGRALRRLGPALRGSSGLLTEASDHHRYGLPVMHLPGPDDVLAIVHAQRRLLHLDSYTAAGPKRERIDSIVRYGVLEAPDVVLTNLVSENGACWVGEAAEGAQRLFCSLIGLDTLAMRSVHSLATAHWFGPHGSQLRDFTHTDLRNLEDALRFKATEAATYLPGPDVDTWLRTTAQINPAAVAFQLMRTMTVNLTLRVQPDDEVADVERHPVAATINELIRSYHVPGKMKEAWDSTEVDGLVAIAVIDEMSAQGRVARAERSSWLGETILPWAGPAVGEDGTAANRLHSATRLLASLTAEHAVPVTEDGAQESVSVVNRTLRHNSKMPGPDARAKVAAAQASAALDLSGEGTEPTVVAALVATFRSSWFWKTTDHGGTRWTEYLRMPLSELAARAHEEREKAAMDPTATAGPAQRAIAALGGVALIVNPGLLSDGRALTRTGRGGGGKKADVKSSDPSILLQRMVNDERGIHQLQDAIAALIAGSETSIPVDRTDHEALTDIYLRAVWLEGDRDENKNPRMEFARQLQELSQILAGCLTSSERLRLETEMTILLDEDDAEDRGDDEEDPLFEIAGINENLADETLLHLLRLNDFFVTGKAFARAAARSNR